MVNTPVRKRAKVAVLISGNGTNLQALIDSQRDGILRHGRITLVISSNSVAHGLKRAEKAGIPAKAITRKQCGSNEAFEEAIIRVLKDNEIDLVVLAGFMHILSPKFINAFRDRIINVHPSLIPSFCGKGCYGLHVHEKALEYGVKVTGATVHYVNEIPDGGRIIMQKAVRIKKDDTPQTLQKRVMAEAEWQILPQSTELICKAILNEKEDEEMSDVKTFRNLIAGNSYPGRGILIGKTPDGAKAVTAYFIMGRSDNSRNRIFELNDGSVYTKPFDESKVEDPSLIIYRALATYENSLIVTNGDQTDTIYDFLAKGDTFENSLETREFEPDFPNLTPRISGMLTFADGDFAYKMSILKAADFKGTRCNRVTFSYTPQEGTGHLIHTYERDGNPLPTFKGEPKVVGVSDSIDDFTDELWTSLDENNRISLYVRYTDLSDGTFEDRLINKNK